MIRATILDSFALGALFVFCRPIFAQGETTSAIVGEVTDASSAVIPGAKVSVTNRETGVQRMSTTDEQGRFSFPQLQPGTYSAKVEAEASIINRSTTSPQAWDRSSPSTSCYGSHNRRSQWK